MMSSRLVCLAIGLAIAGTILYLVRRNRLYGPYALWWLAVSLVMMAAGSFPSSLNRLAGWLGILDPPILLVIVSTALILIKVLTMDLNRSQLERKLRRLSQRMAILEAQLDSLKQMDQPLAGEMESPRDKTPSTDKRVTVMSLKQPVVGKRDPHR